MRHIETVELHNDGSGLGFGIVGGRSTGVIVKTILPRGVADRVCTCIERLTNSYVLVYTNGRWWKVVESLIAALGKMLGELIFIMRPRKGRKLQVV